ncbi:MAG: glutathione S-transferase [Gammaproteobacteria bacterium]|nr:MAG: glutathione S-transferase [Gammaproteobacteria bacterium]
MRGTARLRLYQFPFSHYCEKARWALDLKRADYRVRNLLPGRHRETTLAIASGSSVPILADGDLIVQGSGEIITYLDQRIPAPALTPADEELAGRALAWEAELDEAVGVNLRLWFYFHLLDDETRAIDFLSRESGEEGRELLAGDFPALREGMRQRLRIDAGNAARAQEALAAVFERLDEALAGRDFLVGDAFSRADLTAGALFSPLFGPHAFASRFLGEPLREFVRERAPRRAARWLEAIYRAYRPVH